MGLLCMDEITFQLMPLMTKAEQMILTYAINFAFFLPGLSMSADSNFFE